MTISRIKAEGRGLIIGRLTVPVTASMLLLILRAVLLGVIEAVLPMQGVGELVLGFLLDYLALVITSTLGTGLMSIFMNYMFGRRASVSDLFSAFRENTNCVLTVNAYICALIMLCLLPARLLAYVLRGADAAAVLRSDAGSGSLALVLLCSAAGLAGMIAVSLRYIFSDFLLLDYPERSAAEILEASRALVRGRMGRVFRVQLSFLPMELLGVISMGVADLWIMPYHYASLTVLYRDCVTE